MLQEKLKTYLNKKGIVRVGGLEIKVTIKDFKISYGKERFLIEPIAGNGEIWTEKVQLFQTN